LKTIGRSRRCLLLTLLAAPGLGSPAEPAAPLGWRDVAALVAGSPEVREAEARADGAAGAVSSAGALPNPVVTITGADAEARQGPDRRREWGVSVELPLELLATRGARVAAAKASERAATVEARGARAHALRAVRREFVALAHGQARLEAQLELEEQVARLAALVRRRAERGEARPTEVPRVELELERLRIAIERTRASAEAQRKRLSTTLGVPVSRVEAELERTSRPASRERRPASRPPGRGSRRRPRS
jgi:cobalt-zinc-cadmium efflux system outer membrane protein